MGKSNGLVFGRYVLLDRLGIGAMGRVFKARHQLMDRVVALKIVLPVCATSKNSRKRFFREIKIVGHAGPSQRGQGLRRRPARRLPVHRHGIPGRGGPGEEPATARDLAAGRRDPLRGPGRQGAGPLAREGGRSPGRQADEPLPDQRGRRQGAGPRPRRLRGRVQRGRQRRSTPTKASPWAPRTTCRPSSSPRSRSTPGPTFSASGAPCTGCSRGRSPFRARPRWTGW